MVSWALYGNARFAGSAATTSVSPINAPTDIANCVLWLDASDAATVHATANKVSQWDDKSGAGNTVVQATGANQLSNNIKTLNGKVTLTENSAGQFMTGSSTWPPGSQLQNGSSLFVVYKTPDDNTVDGATSPIVRWPTSNCTAYQHENSGAGTSPNKLESFLINTGSTAFRATPTADWQLNAWRIASILVDTSASTITLYSNGVVITGSNPTTYTGTLNSSTGDTLNIFNDGGAGAAGVNQSIAEIILYNRTVSSTERSQVETYLSNKWALSLGTGVP